MLLSVVLITLPALSLCRGAGSQMPIDPNERLIEDFNYGSQKKMCSTIECPKYIVLNRTKEFEVRKYPPYKYIVAKEEGLNFTEARRTNLLKLRGYLNGGNSLGMKIKAAHPIYNRFVIGGNGKVGNLYAMIFYLPSEYQNNPPLPYSRDVEIVEYDESIAFVQPFNGYASERKILHEHKVLENSLYHTDLDYDPVVFFSAEYNEPWQYFDRYNEIVCVKSKKHVA